MKTIFQQLASAGFSGACIHTSG